ncbi:MAG TPA: hypothetical protein VGW36_00905 [Pyrinomonadaceae bacterium]|nr:hypothetical protein [Pyrinomonadaceae bacterium]
MEAIAFASPINSIAQNKQAPFAHFEADVCTNGVKEFGFGEILKACVIKRCRRPKEAALSQLMCSAHRNYCVM